MDKYELKNHFDKIRNFYKEYDTELRETYPKSDMGFVGGNIPMFFTEEAAWCEIRKLGLPFYPQYPIGKYFVDFCDPIEKIVFEIDGKMWHKNKVKDKKRENEIEAMGYCVVRFDYDDLREEKIDEENQFYITSRFARFLYKFKNDFGYR